ncbi:MAG: Rpn family recombination-promoting nuclease/putative transposase [Clostridium sp.]
MKDDKLHRWLTFLREDIGENELKELMEMDTDIKRAEERIEYLSSDPQTIELYRAREASLHERANLISTGREEGRKEGREEGRNEGIKQGRNEGKYEVARNLMHLGIDIESIKKATGLTEDELKML